MSRVSGFNSGESKSKRGGSNLVQPGPPSGGETQWPFLTGFALPGAGVLVVAFHGRLGRRFVAAVILAAGSAVHASGRLVAVAFDGEAHAFTAFLARVAVAVIAAGQTDVIYTESVVLFGVALVVVVAAQVLRPAASAPRHKSQ